VSQQTFTTSLYVKTNDQMLVVYLAALVRSVLALHNLINNKLTNRYFLKNISLTYLSCYISRDAERKEGATATKKGEKEKDDKDAKKEETPASKDKEEKKK
jgi:26S proteasome regulatory subunit N8